MLASYTPYTRKESGDYQSACAPPPATWVLHPGIFVVSLSNGLVMGTGRPAQRIPHPNEQAGGDLFLVSRSPHHSFPT